MPVTMPWECCLNQAGSKRSANRATQGEEIAAALCAVISAAQQPQVLIRPAPWKTAMRHPELEIDELRPLISGRKLV